MAEPRSLLYQLSTEELARYGFKDKENIDIKITRTHNNAMTAPARGEGDISVTGVQLWKKFGVDYKDLLVVIGTTSQLPGLLFLTNRSVNEEDTIKLKQALLSFGDTENGNLYLSYTGFRGFKEIDVKTRKSTEKYINFVQN
jgi:ABC-type phosphate/phosphonate transport system substrate-binding protein